MEYVDADWIREKASEMELAGIDFLDRHGNIGARGSDVHEVRLYFIDGVTVLTPIAEMQKLCDFRFKLRPVTSH